MMRLLNSKIYKGKEYTLNDVRGFIPNEAKNIPIGFYGGRVTQLAKTETKGLYLCMENMTVIDMLLFEEKLPKPKLEEKTNRELIEILKSRGIEVPKRVTKAELIELLR